MNFLNLNHEASDIYKNLRDNLNWRMMKVVMMMVIKVTVVMKMIC